MAGGGRFVIEQLTGPRRRLELIGPCGPFKGYAVGGTQETSKERNPGNPFAVQHVFGPDEDDTEIKGFWSDVYVGDADGTRISTVAFLDGEPALDIVELIDFANAIRIEGQEVEVRWMHTIRRGLVKAFHASYQTDNDADWDMKFEWGGPDILDSNQARPVPVNVDVSEVAADMATRAGRLALGSYRPYAPEGSAADDISDAVTDLEAAAQALDETASATFVTGMQSEDGMRRAAATLSFIETRADDLIGVLNARQDWADYQLVAPENMTMGQVLLSARLNRSLVREARDMRGAAARQRLAMVEQSSPEMLDIITANEGDDMRQVSMRAYGTPDNFYALCRYNGIQGSRLSAGQVVFIPRTLPRVSG